MSRALGRTSEPSDREPRPEASGGPAQVWLVATLRPDGRRVAVREVNSCAQSTPVTRPRPGLSLDRLQEIALDEGFFAD